MKTSRFIGLGFLGASLFLAGCAKHVATRKIVIPIDAQPPSKLETGRHDASAEFLVGMVPSREEELWVIARPSEPSYHDDSHPHNVLVAKNGEREIPLPLRRTDVRASISGFIATTHVTQQFENPSDTKIEAIYSFSLPDHAAVTEFVMTVGERRIRGIIRERKEAEAIYETAKRSGYVATLLLEERPNVFTQSVANIEPGKRIDVQLRYFQTLTFASGWHEFVFPMPYVPSHQRSEHRISVQVDIRACVPIEQLDCGKHEVTYEWKNPSTVTVALSSDQLWDDTDFHLHYRVTGDRPRSHLLTHRDDRGGFFALALYPPKQLQMLSDVRVDWQGVETSDVFPRQMPDLFAGRPVILVGRVEGAGRAILNIAARTANGRIEESIPLRLDSVSADHPEIANVWARLKLAELTREWASKSNSELAQEIRQLGLDFGLASAWTTFVSVDATRRTAGNPDATIRVRTAPDVE